MSLHLTIFIFYALAISYVHFRGKVRHNILRQYSNFSGFIAPLNILFYAFSKVSTKPYVDVAQFPQLQILKDNWKSIAEEAKALHEAGGIQPFNALNDLGFYNFAKRGWTRFYINWYGNVPPSAERLCPKTLALVKEVKSLRAAMFAILPAGGRLISHRDPFAGSLRYHLGLATPNDDECYIVVDGVKYSWRDGEDVMFDETYIHWAFNKTDQTRIILFCDVERPLWTPVLRAINWASWQVLGNATVARNYPGEPLGFLNRIFPALYVLRTLGKKAKKHNSRIYYFGKYAAFIAIVYVAFFHSVA